MKRVRIFEMILIVFCLSLHASALQALANRVFVSARSGKSPSSRGNRSFARHGRLGLKKFLGPKGHGCL